MSNRFKSKLTLMLAALALIASLTTALAISAFHLNPAHAAIGQQKVRSFCSRLGNTIQASQGAQLVCSKQQNQTTKQANAKVKINTESSGSNVNAANPAEDVTSSGVQAYGQSETSIAAIGNYVVEAWNDATAYFAPCPSPMNKEQGTGLGFSANGGVSFVDEGGLPNNDCQHFYGGDPSVEAWHSGGSDYFYVSSLYNGLDSHTPSYIALAACKATGKKSDAALTCSKPVIAAASTQCETDPDGNTFCSFLDKAFLAIDPVRGRLYVTYTEFGVNNSPPDNLTNGQIELAACDIGTPGGKAGPKGGTAGAPVCFPGGSTALAQADSPYLVVAPGNLSCEQQGAYPAVNTKTGDVYVAFEFNYWTNLFGSNGCRTTPTKQSVDYIPATCLTLPTASCKGPATTNSINIVSMGAALIPGYNRFPMNDFPRIAVSAQAGTVSIVWNDARFHPLGDILLQSFALSSLTKVQKAPVRINSDKSGTPHLLPALRNAGLDGTLNISWYDRRSYRTSAFTDVYAAIKVDPRTTSTPRSNTLITTEPTNWLNVASDIVPNFGDYTDNYVLASSSRNFVVYIAWTDGRDGEPQPFEDPLHVS